ncbi:MAG: TAXI family TRAP transporter solute-binding subunit [Chloroflexi bacterium]|nr:TAXI family TRAP transporter solute-binding subunit [Chloroflexota bacterium]
MSSAINSTYYAYQVAESKYLNTRVPEVSITVRESGGGPENLVRLSRGEAAMATIATSLVYQAYHGVAAYEGKAMPDIRYLWVYAVGARPFIVREDLNINKLADLAGKDFNPGMRGSSTERDVKTHLEMLGIAPRWYTAGMEDAMQAIKDRRIVGMTVPQASIAADAATLDLMATTKMKVVSYSDDEIKKILDKRPWDPFITVKEGEYGKGYPQFKTSASIASIITMKQALSDDVVYKMVKAMMDPAAVQEISPAISWMKGWDYKTRTLEITPTPFHAGAVRYFREIGAKVPEHLIPPEAK